MRPLLLGLVIACGGGSGGKDGGGTGTGDPTGPGGVPADQDGDGSPVGVDCDDRDPQVNPSADERCNGIDDDCDGAVDDADDDVVEAPTWYEDADHDGWGGVPSTVACAGPEGWVEQDGDCADDDPFVRPDATETCNEVDDDCDLLVDDDDPGVDATAWYRDTDGDGHGDPAMVQYRCAPVAQSTPVGDDCDDTDRAVYPGAPEICEDGQLNDCGGTLADAIAQCQWPSLLAEGDEDAMLENTSPWSQLGQTMVAGGDLDQDGVNDVVVGDFGLGTVYLFNGIPTGTNPANLDLVSAPIAGMTDEPGGALALAGDIDLDGLPDLLIGDAGASFGGYRTGALFLLDDIPTYGLDLNHARLTLYSNNTDSAFGLGATVLGDQDGDGYDEIVAGAPYQYEGVIGWVGRVYIAPGSLTGQQNVDVVATATITGFDRYYAGYRNAADDFDGDGIDDLVVGICNGPESAELFRGPLAGAIDSDVSGIDLIGADCLGAEPVPVGDLDNDGYPDLAIGCPDASLVMLQSGYVHLLAGDAVSPLTTAAIGQILPSWLDDAVGGRIAPSDFDVDGETDLLIGGGMLAKYRHSGYQFAASAGGWMFMGPFGGTTMTDQAGVFFDLPTTEGAGVAATDLDGDGVPDVVFGGSEWPDGVDGRFLVFTPASI